MHGQKQCGNAHIKTCAFYAWEEMLIIYVGEKDAYYALPNAHMKKYAFYAWEEMLIIYVGKKRHIMHGQTDGGHAHMKKYAFYAWEEMLIIYDGKKDAYYAWAKRRWECPH